MRIIVPLDRSAFGETAIPHALGLLGGGTLALVTAIDPMLEPTGGVPELKAKMVSASTEYLDEVAGRLPEGTKVETHILGRPITAAISEFAKEFEADLIVMSTHGRGPFSRFWLGSIADRLTRMSPVPLYLVRPAHEIEGRPDLSLEIPRPTKLLAPVDGSEVGAAAIPATRLLGSQDEQTLHLLRIASYPSYVGSSYLPDTIDVNKEASALALANAERYLEELAGAMRSDGRTVLTRVISSQFTAPAILEYAESSGAEAIVLSTHGRSGFSRLALGSVADKVVRRCPVPVLLVPAAE